MTSSRERGGPSLGRSLPVGWQEILNPKLTRRGLLGGLVASPVALFAKTAVAEGVHEATWYDLELVVDPDQSAVAVQEIEVKRFRQDAPPPPKDQAPKKPTYFEERCLRCVWSVPAAAFGEDAYFDMARPDFRTIDHQAQDTPLERVLHVRKVTYGMRFTRQDPVDGKLRSGPDGKYYKPGFVSLRFTRAGAEARWKIAYETDLWLRSTGNTEAVKSSRSVPFETFVGETDAAPDTVYDSNGKLAADAKRKRPCEFIDADRVGKTLELTFGNLLGAVPANGQFDVSLDRNLVWHIEAASAAVLLAHDGQLRSTKLGFAWRTSEEAESKTEAARPGDSPQGGKKPVEPRKPRRVTYFSGEAAAKSLTVVGEAGSYVYGAKDGHAIVVVPETGSKIGLDVIVGRAPLLPDALQTVCALSVTRAAITIRGADKKTIAGGIAAGALTITETITSGARGVAAKVRSVVWGEALGAATTLVPDDKSEDALGRIDTPVGALTVARPVLDLGLDKDEPAKPAPPPANNPTAGAAAAGDATATANQPAPKPGEKCGAPVEGKRAKPQQAEGGALVRFFQVANGDRAGAPRASIYALADRDPGPGRVAIIRRAHIDLSLRGAATSLPDASFSALTFQPTEIRLVYEDGAPIKELPGGEHPLPLASSFVWIGAATPPALPLAVLDLSRAALTCARDYDLMKLKFRFNDLALHYGPEPTVRPARDDGRLRVREDGEVQDSRPLLVAEFDPQHVLEEAIFLPETPALPDVELEKLADGTPGNREAILEHLATLKTTSEKVKFREAIREQKVKKESASGTSSGLFALVAAALKAKIDNMVGDSRPPDDQAIYIGPFALDADAMGLARLAVAENGEQGVRASLNEAIGRAEQLAAAGGPLSGKQLETLNSGGDARAVFAVALRNEAVLESLEPFYGVFRAFWREEYVDPSELVMKAKNSSSALPEAWMRSEYLNANNRPTAYPASAASFKPLLDEIEAAFVQWALGKDRPTGLMGARLSGRSRLAFRINAETPIGVGAREAGALPDSGDGVSKTGAGNTRFRPIRFTFEGLTDWARFEPSVTKRARKLFQTLPSGVLPRPGNRAENPSDQAMMRFQGFTEGTVTGEARMAEVRASLKSERIASLETGEGKPWPGEPLDFETAIELPARLILSTAQDAIWRTNRRMPKELFAASEEKACPVLVSEDAVPTLENGGEPVAAEVTNVTPYDLWSVRLETAGQTPGLRAVASPDLRPTALTVRTPGAIRVPGEGAPPRGPYAPWFIGPDQLENETLEQAPSNIASRLAKWLAARVSLRAGLGKDYEYFRTSLDAYDRHQLVLLTSTYGLPVIGKRLPGATADAEPGGLIAESGQIEPGERFALLDGDDDQALHKPVALDVKALSLTALGGSFLHETAFKPSAGASDLYGRKLFEGFSIDTLQQDIVLGRDIRTEVVYSGYLLPLGHKASFVKLTERIFLDLGVRGIKAILRQRMFLRMADPEKLYGAMGQPHAGRQWCARKVRLTTDKTPDILDPTFPLDGPLSDDRPFGLNGRVFLDKAPGLAFWPRTDVTDQGVFRFPVTIDGAATQLPMMFLDNIAATSEESVLAACKHYNAIVAETTVGGKRPAYTRTMQLAGRKIDYAPNSQAGEGQFETDLLVVRAQGRAVSPNVSSWIGELEALENFKTTGVLEGASQPPFYPAMESATIRLGRVERMTGGASTPVTVHYDGHYVLYGFKGEEPPQGYPEPTGVNANPQEIFLDLSAIRSLDMGDNGDRSGGIARPNSYIVAISRSKGPIGGDEGTWWSAAPGDAQQAPAADYTGGRPSDARLKAAMELGKLVSLAPYFNDAIPRLKPPVPPTNEAKYEDDQDPYSAVDQVGEAIEQVKSFFSMDARLLGTVRLKHIMKLLGLSLDDIPILREVREYGTAAMRDLDSLSNDVRTRVLSPLREIVTMLRREWRKFDETVTDAQAPLKDIGKTNPLSLAAVYPEVETGLKKVETSLDDALATEDAAALVPKLAAVYAAAKQLLRGLAVIAANPIERLDAAITGNLKEKIDALSRPLDELTSIVKSFETLFKGLLDPDKKEAAKFATKWIFAWFEDAAPGAVAPVQVPKLVDLMPLASLPPALPDLLKSVLVIAGTEAKEFGVEVEGIAGDLAKGIQNAGEDALAPTLEAALFALFEGDNAGEALKKGGEAYLKEIRGKIETAIDGAKDALELARKDAVNGAPETVLKAVDAAAFALTEALDQYQEQLEDDLWNAAINLAGRYPDELRAVVTGLEKADAALRNGKTFAEALKGGDPKAILTASAGLAEDVLGVDVASIRNDLEALEKGLVSSFVTRVGEVLREKTTDATPPQKVASPFRFNPPAGSVAILAKEIAAVKKLRAENYLAEKPYPLPIYDDKNSTLVVGSNDLLVAVGKSLRALEGFVDPARNEIDPEERTEAAEARTRSVFATLQNILNEQKTNVDKVAAATGKADADRLHLFIKDALIQVEGAHSDRRDCLIADLEGLYGDVLDVVVATRGLDALLDNPPDKGVALEVALGDILRRLRQLGETMGVRIETMAKRLATFAERNKEILVTGALLGGAATVLNGYIKDSLFDDLEKDVRTAIEEAAKAFDTAEAGLVEDLRVVVDFALLLLDGTTAGGVAALNILLQGLDRITAAATSLGFQIEPETKALRQAIVDLGEHIKGYGGLRLPEKIEASAGKTILVALLDAPLGKGKTPRNLFASNSVSGSYRDVESKLRDLEAGALREWRKLRDRLAGAPDRLRERAEKELLATGVFSPLASVYAKLLDLRNKLLVELGNIPLLGVTAQKTLLVDRAAVLDATEGGPIDPDIDRLAQEAAVADDLAKLAASGGAFDGNLRRRAVALLKGWSGAAAPLVILKQAEDLAKNLMRGDVLAAIDFGAFRDQIEDAIASLIPTKVNLSYDFGSIVTKDAGSKAIFRPLPGSPFGIALRATIDLLQKTSEFGATASIGPFEIFLIGGIVDALRLKFGGAAFTVSSNKSARFDVVYEDFVIGKDLEFAQKLQSFLSPKGGGAFIQPMTRGAGIEVGYGIDLGTIGVGATSFFNVSLNVSAELPFGDQESLFKVSLGRRLSPFTMGVFPFVGSGYFAIYAAANGIRGFEASFEYGGGAAIGYGPFEASCRIQVGVFVRIIKADGKKTTEVYGTFFAGGSASLWIFHFATSLYVRLGTAEGGAMYGEAIYSFSFSLGIADYDYSITAYKKENAIGNSKTAALDGGGATRFAAIGGIDPITTGSTESVKADLVNAASQSSNAWQTYATYFDTALTMEFFP
ncbi:MULTISPECIES: hypothetical protein [unclassified Mesorhizobium]|uniref:hypothetical protein n=1 Tax=unclassified Mesorhizobium TaxID=325217 RepID=UPI0012EB9724|nr:MULTISPECIES: hypothetical protein [unclassified Mesorhizobium]WJI69569.1 hypothetical protein NLY36_01830 [Mesorhizobium sp. C399B]